MTQSILASTAREKSQQSYKSLCEVLPGGVSSPVRAFKGLEVTPLVVERGEGALIYDVDGQSYIDYCGSWGPLIHGHAHPEIVQAAQHRLALGMTFGITTPIEDRLARKVIQHMPSIEKLRFVSSGTEATMSAVRVARGFTRRDTVVKFAGNYHGHADVFLVQAGSGVFDLTPTSSSAGIPSDTIRHTVCLTYNDTDGVRQFLLDPKNSSKVAAVIIEPIAGNMGCVQGQVEFLQMLREVTLNIGAVLIFDEVMTGFRVGLGGAQAYYNIKPDLTCLGKIIGGGFPAAAFGGRCDIMDCLAPLGPVYQAGTLSGNPAAMEAGLKTLEMLEDPNFYKELERKTSMITGPVAAFIEHHKLAACVQQVGSMFTVFFGMTAVSNMQDAQRLDNAQFGHFFRYLFNSGIYIPPSQYEAWFVSQAHEEEHLFKTRDLIMKFLHELI